MFYHDGGRLQYEVKVDTPKPVFAKALQQAIGGIQGRASAQKGQEGLVDKVLGSL